MIAPLLRGSATKPTPAKAGDAKLRGYRTPWRATPVGPPNLISWGGYAFADYVELGGSGRTDVGRGVQTGAASDGSELRPAGADRRQSLQCRAGSPANSAIPSVPPDGPR